MTEPRKQHGGHGSGVVKYGGRAEMHIQRTPHSFNDALKLVAGMHHSAFFDQSPSFQKTQGLLKKLFRSFFAYFERRYGMKLYVSLPASLRDVHPDTWEFSDIIVRLQNAGVFNYVEQLTNLHDEPTLFRYQTAIRGFSAQRNSSSGIGHSFFSEREALETSLGEAIERHCYAQYIPEKSIVCRASHIQLKGSAIDPLTIVGISEEMRAKSTETRLRLFDEETPFTWIHARSLYNDERIWLPLQLITANQHLMKGFQADAEPLIRESVSTGAAVGKEKDDALYRGVCEVIERDAFMIAYLNKLTPPTLSLSELCSERFTYIKRQLVKHSLDLTLVCLPTDFPVHVMMACIKPRDGKTPYFSLGFKTDLDLETACYGAVKEALNARIAYRSMLEHNAETGRDTIPLPTETERIFQYDRVYLWLTNEQHVSELDFLLSGKEVRVKDLPTFAAANAPFADKLLFLVTYLQKNNIEAVYVENTTRDVARALRGTGHTFRSFFVIMPALQHMHLTESLACFSGERLKSVPSKLGYDIDPSYINTFPHPIP